MNEVVLITGLSVVLFIAIVVHYYNLLIRRKNEIDNIKGSLNALLKKRADLIPNLVEIVKEYMKYESNLLKEITSLRTLAINEKNLSKKMEYENKISSLLKKIFAVAENYPELKASENFLQLQYELSDIEAQIAAARRAYSQVITDYNNAVEMFPSNILAKIMGLKREKVFEISEEERKPIDVKELFKSD